MHMPNLDSNSFVHFVPFCGFKSFPCLFVALLCKPSIRIEELDADAAIAVDVVNPRSVYFSRQLTTKWWNQLYSRADHDINIQEERGSAPADLGRFRFRLKRLSCRVRTFNFQRKLDRNSRASGPL